MRLGNILHHAALSTLLLAATTGFADSSEPAVEQRAKDELAKMVGYFEGAQAISFKAIATNEEVSSTLQKLQYNTSIEGAIQRPNKLYYKKSGSEEATLWFDGQTATIFDRKAKKYSKIAVAGNFAALIAKLDSLGIETPFAGLFERGILKHVEDHVFKGDYYGASEVAGVSTVHLAFRQDSIDWQLWTEEATGAPRKVVITSKMLAAAPQNQLWFSELIKNPSIASNMFQATLPADATEVPIQDEDAEDLRNTSW